MSLTEIAVIIFVVLILFGPEDLPEVARALGKIVRQVRRYTSEISEEFKNVIEEPGKIVNDALKDTPVEQKARQSEGEIENTEVLLKYDDDRDLSVVVSDIPTDEKTDENFKKVINS